MGTYFFTIISLFLAFGIISSCSHSKSNAMDLNEYTLVIHGGAGVISKSTMDQSTEEAYRKALEAVLTEGEKILSSGGSAMDAVITCVSMMEDNPLFNAGKGSVFTYDGHNEMDASVMDGMDMAAGAVSGLRHIKNPVQLARAVMDKSPHVFLYGQGAEEFAQHHGIELVDSSYFFTQRRWDSHQRALEEEKTSQADKHGTVGAVARDQRGNLAAATSTGGMTNKRWNRVGDTPVIGAGTYANNETCAISCTGHGEYFIRWAVAHDISSMMEYGQASLKEAASHVVMEKLARAGGDGGVIGVDRQGNLTMTFNSEGMYRGYVKPGERYVGIFGNE